MLPHSMHSCDVRRKCRQGLAGARMASISRRKNKPTCIFRALLQGAGSLSRVVRLLAVFLRACCFLAGTRSCGRPLRSSRHRHRSCRFSRSLKMVTGRNAGQASGWAVWPGSRHDASPLLARGLCLYISIDAGQGLGEADQVAKASPVRRHARPSHHPALTRSSVTSGKVCTRC